MIPKIGLRMRISVLRILQGGGHDHRHEDAMHFAKADAQNGLLNVFCAVGQAIGCTVANPQHIGGEAGIDSDEIGERVRICFHIFQEQQQPREQFKGWREIIGVGYEIFNLFHGRSPDTFFIPLLKTWQVRRSNPIRSVTQTTTRNQSIFFGSLLMDHNYLWHTALHVHTGGFEVANGFCRGVGSYCCF